MTQVLRGMIIDLDGTLIASNDAHARAWADALAEHSYPNFLERVRPLMGMGGDNLLPALLGLEKAKPLGASIDSRRKAIFKERYLSAVQPTPGARALLEHMTAEGLRLALATSSSAEELEPLLAIAGVADLLDQRTSSSDTASSKPDPDVVSAALARLGFQPSEVLMLGDTPYDIEAARKTGVATIALRSGGFTDNELAGALAIYDDPDDMLAHYADSPIATFRRASVRG